MKLIIILKEVKKIFDKSLYLIENKNKIDESNEIFNNYKLDYKVKDVSNSTILKILMIKIKINKLN